ncbi:MAG: hypothetical protein HC927_11390, partial [Deltaproteobacteria bacterium]|nr:hypothetical protein [Deltaproteobacteria bacterium]
MAILLCLIIIRPGIGDEPIKADWDRWLCQLSADSYLARQHASDLIRKLATHVSQAERTTIEQAIARHGLTACLETQIATTRLRMMIAEDERATALDAVVSGTAGERLALNLDGLVILCCFPSGPVPIVTRR